MAVGELMPQANLQAVYHLSDLNDSSGNGRTLTNSNAVVFSPGKFGFGGDGGPTNSNKSLTHLVSNMGITTSTPFSIGCWVRVDTSPGTDETQTFMTFSSGTSTNAYTAYFGYRDSSSTKQIYLTSYATANVTTPITFTVDIGRWYDLILTDDVTTIKLYLNGAEVISTGRQAGDFNWGSVGVRLLERAGDFFAKGMVDEAFVFNKVLTKFEIKRYHDWALGRFSHVV